MVGWLAAAAVVVLSVGMGECKRVRGWVQVGACVGCDRAWAGDSSCVWRASMPRSHAG